MNLDDTIAGKAQEKVYESLKRFCEEHGSANKAAGILKAEGLSFQWIKAFAGGQITNPTVGKLQTLERRLAEVQAEAKAA